MTFKRWVKIPSKTRSATIIIIIVAAIVLSWTIWSQHSNPLHKTSTSSTMSTQQALTSSTKMTTIPTHTSASPAIIKATKHKMLKETLKIIDVAGRHVLVHIPVKRVVLIDGGKTGYILAIDAIGGKNALRKIVGLDLSAWKKDKKWMYEEYIKACPWLRSIANIGSLRNLNISKIIELKPDVVIAPLYAQNNKKMIELEEAGIPVVFIDYQSGTWRHFYESTMILGMLFGNKKRAGELIRWYKERLDILKSRLKDLTTRPKVCIISVSQNNVYIYGNYSWGRIAELAGGVNIALNNTIKYREINPKYIVKKNPDIILIIASSSKKSALRLGYYINENNTIQDELLELIKRFGWNNVSAVRHGKVYVISNSLAGNVWNIIALEFLAKALYPARFKDVKPVRDLQEFYREFLSINYSGLWMYKLKIKRREVTIVDVLGRKVKVKVPVEKAAILYGLQDWVAVGGEDALAKVVALNSWRYMKWRPDWWTAFIEHYPWLAKIPDTGQPGINFNVEVLLKTKPDVVVTTPWMYEHMVESGDIKRLKMAGIPVVVIDFIPPTTNITKHLETIEKSIKILGILTGYEDRARELINYYKSQINLVLEKLKNVKKKPKVIVLTTWSTWRAYGKKGMYNIWITLAKGINIAAKVISGFSGNINPEFILKENPDVIIFACNNNFPNGQKVVIGYTVNSTAPAKEALKELIRRPGWQYLKAVREKRVYLFYHGLSHGHIFQFVALQYIAKWLHPKIFKDLDPLKNLKEFYERFMPFSLKGVWAVGLGGS